MIVRILILSVVLFLSALSAHAQRFVWDVDLVARFDNREYKTALERSQTIFGARFTPQLGLGWGRGSYIKLGNNLMADFAAKSFTIPSEWLLYYGYEQRNLKVMVGRLPRAQMRGEYSMAVFSDSTRFYDNDIEGALFQFDDQRHWFAEVGCDWNSHLDQNSREKFILFASSHYRIGMLTAGFNFNMYHHAGTQLLDGVVDNMLVNPFLEGDFTRWLPFEQFSIRLNYLQALQNDRKYVNRYVKPCGSLIEMRIEKWGLGIYDACYQGADLMPYYDRYGNSLYVGEPFFRTQEKIYNRLEAYWRPFRRHNDLDLLIASVHHFDGRTWNWQQVIQLSVTIGDKMFRKRP